MISKVNIKGKISIVHWQINELKSTMVNLNDKKGKLFKMMLSSLLRNPALPLQHKLEENIFFLNLQIIFLFTQLTLALYFEYKFKIYSESEK